MQRDSRGQRHFGAGLVIGGAMMGWLIALAFVAIVWALWGDEIRDLCLVMVAGTDEDDDDA